MGHLDGSSYGGLPMKSRVCPNLLCCISFFSVSGILTRIIIFFYWEFLLCGTACVILGLLGYVFIVFADRLVPHCVIVRYSLFFSELFLQSIV